MSANAPMLRPDDGNRFDSVYEAVEYARGECGDPWEDYLFLGMTMTPESEFARQYADSYGLEVNEYLYDYIDWHRFGYDLLTHGDYQLAATVDGYVVLYLEG